MKQLFFTTMVVFFLVSCGGENNNKNAANKTETPQEKQLNISILLDLSDRINPDINPDAQKNDIGNIENITKFFRASMKHLGASNAKGKIRLFFIPPPPNSEINSIVSKLNIDCSEDINKKEIYDSLTVYYEQNLKKIYAQTIATSTWQDGSDIWGFFKDGVHRCIEKDTNYRNILIIFTNGYLWANGRTDDKLTNTTSIQPKYLTKWHGKNSDNWNKEKEDTKIQSTRNDLQDLEILVIGIKADNPKEKIDEDILIYLWGKWFNEMGVKDNYKILVSDLPSTLEIDIKNFLNSK